MDRSLAALSLRAGLAAPAPALLSPKEADAGLLREVLRQTRVARSPSGPGAASYFEALFGAIVRWVEHVLKENPGLAGGVLVGFKIAALLVVAAAAAFLGVSLWRWARRPRGQKGAAVPRLEWRAAPAAPASTLDAEQWMQRSEACLAAGDVAGALEALWWWFAASLAPGAPVDPSWTTREVLRRARRPELARAGAALDVLMYGRRCPSPADIAACRAGLEQSLR